MNQMTEDHAWSDFTGLMKWSGEQEKYANDALSEDAEEKVAGKIRIS